MSASGKTAVIAATFLGLTPAQIVALVGTIAEAVVPEGALVAGMSIDTLTKLAVGVANEIPEAISAYQEIKATATSGTPPTAEQWAAWNAAADAAHAAAQAAQDEILQADESNDT